MLNGRDRRGGRPRAGRRSWSRRATTGCARSTRARRCAPDVEVTTAQAALPRSVEEIRADFPILAREFGGKPVVYLDNAATAQKPAVGDRGDRLLLPQLERERPPQHARARRRGRAPVRGRPRARSRRSSVRPPREIVFVRNATEAINLVRYTWAREHVGAGDVVLITEMEHHSNIVPWQLLCEEQGAQLEYLRVDGQGRLDLDGARRAARRRPRAARRGHACLQRARHDQPGRRDRRARARRGRAGAGRRRAGGAADARRRAGDRRRLLRLHRPQDARADRHRRAVGAP